MKKIDEPLLFNKARNYLKQSKTYCDLINDYWHKYDFNSHSDFVANRLATVFNVNPNDIKCYIEIKRIS